MARRLGEELDYLSTRDPRACAVLAATNGGDAAIQFGLAPYLDRYQAAGAAIIATSAAPRPAAPAELSERTRARLDHRTASPLADGQVNAQRFAGYCSAEVWLYRVLTAAPAAEAAEAFRQMLKP